MHLDHSWIDHEFIDNLGYNIADFFARFKRCLNTTGYVKVKLWNTSLLQEFYRGHLL